MTSHNCKNNNNTPVLLLHDAVGQVKGKSTARIDQ